MRTLCAVRGLIGWPIWDRRILDLALLAQEAFEPCLFDAQVADQCFGSRAVSAVSPSSRSCSSAISSRVIMFDDPLCWCQRLFAAHARLTRARIAPTRFDLARPSGRGRPGLVGTGTAAGPLSSCSRRGGWVV